MTAPDDRKPWTRPWLAVLVGLAGGALVIALVQGAGRFADLPDARLEIGVNGVDARRSRDLVLPPQGWVLEVRWPAGLPRRVRDSLAVTLREERSGAKIEVADRMDARAERATLVMPESLRLPTGLLSIHARLRDEEGRTLDTHRRVRIRDWPGGPPIGSRQTIHFDFAVDRDDDGRPDFELDLERFGLASPERPELARRLAARVARIALARVERAYAGEHDPNRTGRPRDPVRVRFVLAPEAGPFVTRICVGGVEPERPESLGHVRFDPANARHASSECGGDPPAGIFPSGLAIYATSTLYRASFDPFSREDGGVPIGGRAGDSEVLAAVDGSDERGEGSKPDGSRTDSDANPRQVAIERAIAVFGRALGTLMAHEAAHALGLVPEGRPAVGLFGGGREKWQGVEVYAHNIDPDGRPTQTPWLMNPGQRLDFEALAGAGERGELQFRPLNYAYLRDRVVLIEARR